MDYLDDYRKMIIEPLEKMKKDIIIKYEKTFFFKKHYEKLLDKIENELMNKYQRFYEMSEEEINFQEYINKKIEC